MITANKYFIGLIVLFQLFGCTSQENINHNKMIEILANKSNYTNPETNIYANKKRLAWLQKQNYDDIASKLQHQAVIANEMLNAGYPQQAIEKYNYVLNTIDSLQLNAPDEFINSVLDLLAITNLRLGEETNCLDGHNSESCIIPIRGSGIHRDKSGANQAIEIYKKLLSMQPNDFVYRWLINLAYMLKGDFPEGVPEQWLIPQLKTSESIEFPEFKEIGSKIGLDHIGLAGGSITEDFDNDGDIDILASSWGNNNQIQLFINDGNGHFANKTNESNLIGITGGLNIVHGDYNNDGFVDIFVLRGGWFSENGKIPNSLLKNNGDGTFIDVTISAKVYSEFPTQTASWGDYNNDGLLDLIIGNETTNGPIYNSELYHNNGDGTFTEKSRSIGLNIFGFIKAVVWGDIDNDGDQDLFVSRLGQPNSLYRNNGEKGNWSFTDISNMAGVLEPIDSFPAWIFDYNNDGWEDIWVSGYDNSTGHVAMDYLGIPNDGETPRLYKNNKNGTFSNVTLETNMNHPLLTMGSNFGDINNDGFLDIYIGTGDPDYRSIQPNRMFINENGKKFKDVTFESRLGHLQKGHGVSFADIDRDGDLDIHAVMGGAYEGSVYQNTLYENPGNWNTNWIGLSLHGSQSNTLAIGARIEVVLETGNSIYRTVSSGGSFGGNPFQQMIGIGQNNKISSINIFWPKSGENQVLNDLGINRWHYIIEPSS